MVQVEVEQVHRIGTVLNDKNRPLKERFRALFTLRNIGGGEAIKCIETCFKDDSALLKHELAYCLGQMQDEKAVPILEAVLRDLDQEPMVRHEAGEALGAIGGPGVLEILEEFAKDPIVEVKETCQIALERVKWLQKGETVDDSVNPFQSVDPSPPNKIKDVAELKRILMDEKESLFDRYRAMFSLRNLGTEESIVALATGLKSESSALFRHEVAFVLGQLQHKCSIPFLIENLKNESENEMVRHECAEALGSIATEECMEVLNEYLADGKRVVKESCEIALDMCEYENSPEFQYADTLTKIN